MKNQFSRLAVTIGLSAMLGSALLMAQPSTSTTEIPFDFKALDQTMPAGTYSVTELSFGPILQLRNKATGETALLLSHREMSDKGEPRVVFHRYGENYFLSQIWLSPTDGFGVPRSREEKELRKGPATVASIRLK